MDNKDIETLIKILQVKKRHDLELLLDDCFSEVEQSGQFGSRWNSILSSFLIYAPVEQYYKLRDLGGEDQGFILNTVLDIYPVSDGAPEIKSIEFRILKEGNEKKYENKELSLYVGRTVRVFLSYSVKDKEFAGNLKTALEELGLEVFLAHEDINPSSDWAEVILKNLKSTDIFMPIITKAFSESLWTDQESGVALSENKFIFPIAVDGNIPYGFLGSIQAFKQDSKFLVPANKIIEAIIKSEPEFSSPLLDSLIKAFVLSNTYDDAGLRASLLLKLNTMTAEQANEIFRGILQNNQIFDSWSARGNVKMLFAKYHHLLDGKLLEEIKNKEDLLFLFEP